MTFEQFYVQEYLERHADRRCRLLHLLGLAASAAFLAFVIWLRVWSLLLLVPVPCYLLSWLGHVIAGNRPTVAVHPWWSFRGYWRMIGETLTGRIRDRALSEELRLDTRDGSPIGPAVPSHRPG